MGVQVNIANGSQSGGDLKADMPFEWTNYDQNNSYTLTNCGDFCHADSYTVPRGTANGPGVCAAHTKPGINPADYSFTDPGWNAPGQPRIVVNPMPNPMPMANDREVA